MKKKREVKNRKFNLWTKIVPKMVPGGLKSIFAKKNQKINFSTKNGPWRSKIDF